MRRRQEMRERLSSKDFMMFLYVKSIKLNFIQIEAYTANLFMEQTFNLST